MALRSYKNLFSSQWNHNVNKSEIKYNTQCVLFQPQAGFQCTEMPRSFTKWHALIVLLVHCRVYLSSLVRTRPRFTVSSKMDLNGPQKIEIFKKLDPLHVNSHQKKFHLKRLRNGIVMVRLDILQRCMEYCSAAGSKFCI